MIILSQQNPFATLTIKVFRTVKKKYFYNITPMSKFDDGLPDYHERTKQSFKASKPLIAELVQFIDRDALPREKYDISFTEGDPNCFGTVKLYSYILIGRILVELGLICAIINYSEPPKAPFTNLTLL